MHRKEIAEMLLLCIFLFVAAVSSSRLDDQDLQDLLEQMDDAKREGPPFLEDPETSQDGLVTGTATDDQESDETPLDGQIDNVDHMEEERKLSETSDQETAEEDMIDDDPYENPRDITSFVDPRYEGVGCYYDKGGEKKPLPLLLRNLRPQINGDWTNLGQIIQLCANLAEQKGYNYFAIQFWGECYSGPTAGQTYFKDGPSKDCAVGVGKSGSNFVYRFKPKTTAPPETTTAPPPPTPTLPGECRAYKELVSADRSVNQGPLENGAPYKCDKSLTAGWYRFNGAAGNQMPTSCVPKLHCGTHSPGWMEGTLPSVAEGSVERGVCFSWNSNCCFWREKIMVRNCGGYFVYKLQKPPVCRLRYCGKGIVAPTPPKPTTAELTTVVATTVQPTTVAPPTSSKPTPKPISKRLILCENRSRVLRCSIGKRIKIHYANYGRTAGRWRCPHKAIRTMKCISRFAANLIGCACNGRNSCPLFAVNKVYGDPCRGTYKYIDIKYRCI